MFGKKKITASMTLAEVLSLDEKLVEILVGFGLHCFSCPLSQMETLEEAALVHDVDLKYMLKKLNEEYKRKK